MGGKAHQADLHGLDIERDLDQGLRGIAVKKHAPFAAERTDFGKRLDDADFVVSGHDGYQTGILANGLGKFLDIHEAVAFHR